MLQGRSIGLNTANDMARRLFTSIAERKQRCLHPLFCNEHKRRHGRYRYFITPDMRMA
jgi:hypothetical protein